MNGSSHWIRVISTQAAHTTQYCPSFSTFLVGGDVLGRVQNKTTSILPAVPFPFPSSRILQAEKSYRNGSDTADTLSGTSAGKQTWGEREGEEGRRDGGQKPLKINLFSFLFLFLHSSPSP